MAEIFVKFCLVFLFCQKTVINAKEGNETVKDRYYPRYHLAPPHGWMNDPNGFSIFKNEYHLFYQYNPKTSQNPGIAHWAHSKSKDLLHWVHEPIALYPDQPYDKDGVFSGSALVENDVMYIYYTSNLNHPDEKPDHEQHQILVTSKDAVEFTKLPNNPIINGTNRQPNFRDPKVWKHEDTYYMVLGNSFENDTLGRVLLYASKDKISWNEVSILAESNGTLGYMWECPDFFELDGKFVLLFSPQGVKPQEDKYRNLYQVGYFIGDFDYSTHEFTPTGEFMELDHGHDFYATQTLLDSLNRRIVVAWFDMWEQDYPERNDGFTGQMTLARELRLTPDDPNNIIQKPVDEVLGVRGSIVTPTNGPNGAVYTFKDKAGEVNINSNGAKDLTLHIESDTAKVSITYDAVNGTVTLERGGNDGDRRTEWIPEGELKWRVFIDASSVELFCGEGEVTFSSRFFPEGSVSVRLAQQSGIKRITAYDIPRTVSQPFVAKD